MTIYPFISNCRDIRENNLAVLNPKRNLGFLSIIFLIQKLYTNDYAVTISIWIGAFPSAYIEE